jgi:hypothetical protein
MIPLVIVTAKKLRPNTQKQGLTKEQRINAPHFPDRFMNKREEKFHWLYLITLTLTKQVSLSFSQEKAAIRAG